MQQHTADRILDRLGLPHDLAGYPMMQLIGARRLRVDQHQGISTLSDTLVVVDTRRGRIAVSGTDLTVDSMDRDTVILSGFLADIDLSGLR